MTLYSTEDELYTGLLSAESDFLEALCEGTEAVDAFALRLSSLQHSAQGLISHDSVSDLTISTALSVATNISKFAESFLDIEKQTEGVSGNLYNELDSILKSLSLDAETPPRESDMQTKSADIIIAPKLDDRPPPDHHSKLLSKIALPLHIVKAYEWLTDHIHNPYPSKAIKTRIAAESGTSFKVISEWFSNARRRIGWTSILNKYFNGNRALAIDSAFSALVDANPLNPVPPKVLTEFLRMKATALNLYEGKLSESCLAKGMGSNSYSSSSNSLHSFHSFNPKHINKHSSEGTASGSPTPTSASADTSDSEENQLTTCRSMPRRLKRRLSACFEDSAEDGRPRVSKRKRTCSDDRAVRSCFNALPYESTCTEKDVPFSSNFSGRTTSSSSSRSSSTEPSTPEVPYGQLQPAYPSEMLDEWFSDLDILNAPSTLNPPWSMYSLKQLETTSNPTVLKEGRQRNASHSQSEPTFLSQGPGDRKRCLSDPSSIGLIKKPRIMNTSVLSPRTPPDTSSPFVMNSEVDVLDILSHIDFTLPPPASFSNIIQGEPLQLDSLTYLDAFNFTNTDPDAQNNHQSIHSMGSSIYLDELDSTQTLAVFNARNRTMPVGTNLSLSQVNNEDVGVSGENHVRTAGTLPTFPPFPNTGPTPPSVSLDSLKPAAVSEFGQLAKLERINHLLAEAAKLQQEVFG